jgi:hypothetical protein
MEALTLHAEVKALQNRLGISYKDAAHRLYSAEVSKMKALKELTNSFQFIRRSIDIILVDEIKPPILNIDSGKWK